MRRRLAAHGLLRRNGGAGEPRRRRAVAAARHRHDAGRRRRRTAGRRPDPAAGAADGDADGSILGLTHHGAFAVGIIATAMLRGPSVDFASYLFGDIFAVTPADLAWLAGGGAVVAIAMWRLWPSLLRVSLDEDLAAAEGVDVGRTRTAFTLALALAIAVAMKIVGIL
ncbi:MAG: metal ABC transporter permease, partial [Hyphomicrobium sp.]|nr:metal ABC transporter permease [Hyphomicrobium sp.]